MSLLTSTMSMLASSVWKNGHSFAIACRNAMPLSGCCLLQALTAAPKPYHAGSISRHCDQENTQGIARRSSILVEVFRDEGRLPMLSLEISPITVDSRKYVSKPGVS